MPHGKICYLEIPANDAQDSARFYSDIFGWKVRERGDGNLAFDDTGGVSGTWVKESDRTPDERTRTYIMVDSIAESLKQIESAGGRVQTPLRRLHFRIRGEIIIILRFERRVCRWESCRMHQFTGMWLNPNSRGSRLRIWQPWGCNSLHAHHFTATGFSGNSRPRRLKIAEPSGCKSRVADRRVVNRE